MNISPRQVSKLRSVGRVIGEAARRQRAGEVDPKLLKSLGMTGEQFAAFVEKYAARFGKFIVMPGRTERPGMTVKGAFSVPGFEGTQRGRGADSGVGASGGEGLKTDKLRRLYESPTDDVSPEYRKQVEAYLRAISEGPDAKKKSAEGK